MKWEGIFGGAALYRRPPKAAGVPLNSPVSRNRRLSALFITLGLAGLIVSVLVVYPHARRHDFLSFYSAASLARQGRFDALYNPSRLLARQNEIVGGTGGVILFNRPLPYATLLAPLSWLPYDRAFLAWLALNSTCLLGCWLWAVRQFGHQAVLFGALYPPVLLGVAHGQDCALLLCLATAAYILAKRGRAPLSGALLGLGLFKFHLFLLWPLAMVLRRNWRMLTGFCLTGGAVWLLPTLAMDGSSYLKLLASPEADVLALSAHKQVSVWGLLANGNATSVGWGIALAAVLSMLVLLRVGEASTEGLFATVISGSLAVAPHVYGYDAAILLLPLWLTMFHGGGLAKQGARLLALPPIWAFLAFDPPLTGVTAACVLGYVVLAASPGKLARIESGLLHHSDGLKPAAVRIMPSCRWSPGAEKVLSTVITSEAEPIPPARGPLDSV
jgi:hypothetical protein